MSSAPDEPSRWIRRFHPAPEDAPRMICFPHAGGSASYYFPMSKSLSPQVEILAVQYPGRQDRRSEPLLDSIGGLADGVFEALRSWSGRPFVFFGHSMGALVAYEVARRFQERTPTGPRCLFVSGRRAPSLHRPGTVHLRDDPGFVADLVRLGGTDQRFLQDQELLELTLPVARSDYKAVETYSHVSGPPLECPITAFVGDRDPEASVEDVKAWSEHTAGGLDLQVFPGGHFYLDACRAEVAGAVVEALNGQAPAVSVEGSAGR
ncbi:thioesterase II family protein [Kitasatospora sp. NPDC058032]|uniref:thioesterase II family protein n=1 Tax=Kitasatospora sp. NPDC058032 TaxID=3346307 RepID=UPI0036D86606